MKTIAALFVRPDSVYKLMPGVDCWDEVRDARHFAGGHAIVAHPPCRLFGQLAHMSKAPSHEKELAYLAVKWARLLGGVVEHPAHSRLWTEMGMVGPGSGVDEFGGLTVAVNQFAWGHKARKPTWLYIVGCAEIPTMPVEMGQPTHCVARRTGQNKPHISKPLREATPPAFAAWLVEVARRCAPGKSSSPNQA